MARVRGTRIGIGFSLAALLGTACLAVFYLGWRVVGLPFPPFDVFDWTARVLPGAFIAVVIDKLVFAIEMLGVGPIATAAKIAEQTMAISGAFITALVLGVILFVIVRASEGRRSGALGIACGLALGLPLIVIGHQLSQTARTPPAVSALWVLALCLTWGSVLAWASRRLTHASAPIESGGEQAWVERLDRRRFLLRLGGSTAAITVVGAVVGDLAETRRQNARRVHYAKGRWSANHPLPNADAAVRPVPGTRPEFTPLERHYRIDIDTTPPDIEEERWKLKVFGLVEKPTAFSLDELRRYPAMHQFITLACISNPVGGDLIGTTRWTGVSLQRLVPDLHLKPAATHLKLRAADGFFEVVSLDTIKADERVMLTYAWDGVPLTPEHGFPLRIFIPGLYGMKQPKWLESMEVVDHWEPGYWVKRGWDKEARMRPAAVIDTIGSTHANSEGNDPRLVAIGGIAHAGERGISKVEVQADDGPWQPASLRTPMSSLTWVLWRYEWPFEEGSHTFKVRCYDGHGTLQTAERHSPRPSGATGLHSRTQSLHAERRNTH